MDRRMYPMCTYFYIHFLSYQLLTCWRNVKVSCPSDHPDHLYHHLVLLSDIENIMCMVSRTGRSTKLGAVHKAVRSGGAGGA